MFMLGSFCKLLLIPCELRKSIKLLSFKNEDRQAKLKKKMIVVVEKKKYFLSLKCCS